ncbi:MAG: hypothetical protein IKU26_03905 [Clostridia bacterium]|nr:hypothetical protein [Clostridia bacterium]
MAEQQPPIFPKEIFKDFEAYYFAYLSEGVPCWNDAILRERCEEQWIQEKKMLPAWTPEECFQILQTQLEAGDTVLLHVARNSAAWDGEKTKALLKTYLAEDLLVLDWEEQVDAPTVRRMNQFAEAFFLLECVYPEDFGEFCVEWLPKIPLEHEFVPEKLMKGLLHTKNQQLECFLTTETFHRGIQIGLLNYLCESDIRRDTLYGILKRYFKEAKDAEEKQFLGVLLGDYGNPGAILVLRKYLESLVRQMPLNMEWCREIASAIYKLGGQYEDIMHI